MKEAIDTLQGNGPKDLVELVLTLGSHMVVAAEKAASLEEARKELERSIEDGSAFKVFQKFIVAQGGSLDQVLHPEKLPKANYIEDVLSVQEGYVAKIKTEEIGRISLLLGGGRETKESEIDLAVGLVLNKKRGDYIKVGETIATIHANDTQKLQQAKERLLKAYSLSNEFVDKEEVIKEIITE